MPFGWMRRKRAPSEALDLSSRFVSGGFERTFAVGDHIGGEFKVHQVLHGGMGAVYVVAHRELDSPIVLKSPTHGEDASARAAFRREAETWVSVGWHPNLVHALWARELHGRLFVAAEFVPPDDLGRNSVADYVSQGPVPLPVILKWTAQFCYGMSYAGEHGMSAHRDIKPANLMVTVDGDIKVTDFGIAKADRLETPGLPRAGGPLSPLTMTGAGTVAYMAPEQILGTAEEDCRTDIYSFGISLFEMCTGKVPFRADSLEAIAKMHLSAPPPPTGTVLDPLIAKCLAKLPADRFRSFQELLDFTAQLSTRLQSTLPRRPVMAPVDAQAVYSKALSYSTLGDPVRALELTERYIELQPEDHRGWTQRGVLMLAAGRLDDARYATEKSIELNPLNSHAWNNLGLILLRSKETQRAADALVHALAVDPFNTGAMLNLSDPLTRLGRVNEALDVLKKALRLQPQKASLWQNLGALYVDLGQFREAYHCFRKALELNPGLTEARNGLELLLSNKARADPIVLLRLRRLDEAKEILVEQTATAPDNLTAWHNLGLIHLEQKNPAEAMRCFTNVHKLDPTDDYAIQQLVTLHSERGEFDRALGYCERLANLPGQEGAARRLKSLVVNRRDAGAHPS